MYKTAGNKTIKLIVAGNRGGIKYEIIHYLIVAESGKGNNGSYNYNN